MSYVIQKPIGDWTSDAREAMQKSPDYFVWWYTVKSVGLAAVACVAAYYVGKQSATTGGRK